MKLSELLLEIKKPIKRLGNATKPNNTNSSTKQAPAASKDDKDQAKNTNKEWNLIGHGTTADVWEHIKDKGFVIKVVGGSNSSDQLKKNQKLCTVAFTDFCQQEGASSHPSDDWRKHYPNILSVDNEGDLMKIRMEKLKNVPEKVADDLEYFADMVERNISVDKMYEYTNADLSRFIQQNDHNSVESLYAAIKCLIAEKQKYGKKYGVGIILDLHAANWLQTSNGMIVAADPWLSN